MSVFKLQLISNATLHPLGKIIETDLKSLSSTFSVELNKFYDPIAELATLKNDVTHILIIISPEVLLKEIFINPFEDFSIEEEVAKVEKYFSTLFDLLSKMEKNVFISRLESHLFSAHKVANSKINYIFDRANAFIFSHVSKHKFELISCVRPGLQEIDKIQRNFLNFNKFLTQADSRYVSQQVTFFLKS